MASPDPSPRRTRFHRRNGFIERVMARYRGEDIELQIRRDSRKRPPGMAPALVEPPRGPLPLSGGAEAPLEFD
ncbi:hypothetical protein [Aurantiacibacter aquimixticola]|uniref:hypothetical protein n=1 Tax=Aurantiacibacter aquimixticola TaxID=1958945 RepID=UPI00105884B7|nr:hypothetical protein [Aurantiacibacter aquimixticola]